jgi:hypothetical protein
MRVVCMCVRVTPRAGSIDPPGVLRLNDEIVRCRLFPSLRTRARAIKRLEYLSKLTSSPMMKGRGRAKSTEIRIPSCRRRRQLRDRSVLPTTHHHPCLSFAIPNYIAS